MELQIGSNQLSRHLSVCSCARTTAVDVGRNVVYFRAVLVSDDHPFGRPRVGSQHHAILEDDSRDGGARLAGRGQSLPLLPELGLQERVPSAVVEAEPAARSPSPLRAAPP